MSDRVPHEPPAVKLIERLEFEIGRLDADGYLALPCRTCNSAGSGMGVHELFEVLTEAVERLKAHEARPAPPLDWQPMETAPKDGTPILVYFTSVGIHRVFWSDEPFSPGIGCWCVTDNKNEDKPLRGYIEEHARGWMPLPDPPAAVPPPVQESK